MITGPSCLLFSPLSPYSAPPLLCTIENQPGLFNFFTPRRRSVFIYCFFNGCLFVRFQTFHNNSHNTQPGVQMDATCNIPQCWELLANNVAFVCTGLHGQFVMFLGKESGYRFRDINPLNTDTRLIRTLSMAPSTSLLTGFDCIHLRLIVEVQHHVYVKRQTGICTTWPSFPFTCRLLLIISTHKLVVSRNFLAIRIVLGCFYLLSFYFEKFSTLVWRLPFAEYVKLKLSNNSVFNNTPYLESVPASSLSEFSEFKLVYIVSKRKLKVLISSVLCTKIYPASLDAGA